MKHRRRSAGKPQDCISTADSDDRERERKELDRRLDEALACTFPASDPFDLSPRGRTPKEPT